MDWSIFGGEGGIERSGKMIVDQIFDMTRDGMNPEVCVRVCVSRPDLRMANAFLAEVFVAQKGDETKR